MLSVPGVDSKLGHHTSRDMGLRIFTQCLWRRVTLILDLLNLKV